MDHNGQTGLRTSKETEKISPKISQPTAELLDRIEELIENFENRKKQMIDYLRHGIASASFEGRVRLKIPKNDTRPSSLTSPFHSRNQR